jgi:hypothetical protein
MIPLDPVQASSFTKAPMSKMSQGVQVRNPIAMHLAGQNAHGIRKQAMMPPILKSSLVPNGYYIVCHDWLVPTFCCAPFPAISASTLLLSPRLTYYLN